MGRRLFAIASVFSLLLCMALVALWVRSFRVCSEFIGTSWVKSLDGEIELVHMIELSGPANQSEYGNQGETLELDPPKAYEYQEHPTGAFMIEPDAFGFRFTEGSHFFMQDDKFYESTWTCYIVPYWLFVVAAAVLPTIWVANRRWAKRKQLRVPRVQPASEQSPSI